MKQKLYLERGPSWGRGLQALAAWLRVPEGQCRPPQLPIRVKNSEGAGPIFPDLTGGVMFAVLIKRAGVSTDIKMQIT